MHLNKELLNKKYYCICNWYKIFGLCYNYTNSYELHILKEAIEKISYKN